MCFTSDKDSNSLSQSSFKLLIELVDTDSVHEVVDWLVIWFTSEYYCNIEGNKDIIICGAGSHRELVCHILLSNKELDPRPRKTEHKSSFFFDRLKLSMGGNNSVGSLGNIDVWGAWTSLRNQNDWGLTLISIVTEPL